MQGEIAMTKRIFGRGPLNAILELLEFHVNKMIELQKQEDAVPNPPDFQKKVEDYNLTVILKSSEDLLQKDEEDPPEEFDFGAENMAAIKSNLGEILRIFDLKPPAEWVFEYPFKTEGGRDLESHFDGASNSWTDLTRFPYLSRPEKDKARQTVKDCLALLEKNFPDLADSDSEDKMTSNQHYFIKGIFFLLRRTPENIGLSTRRLIRHLRYRFWLWLKYQWRRLFAAPTR